MKSLRKGTYLLSITILIFCILTSSNLAFSNTNAAEAMDYSTELKTFLNIHTSDHYEVKKINGNYLVTKAGNASYVDGVDAKTVPETLVNEYFQNKTDKSADAILRIILKPGPK